MITTAVVVLVAVLGPAISTTALTPVTTAPTTARVPRARAPPTPRPTTPSWTRPKALSLPDLTESLVHELQADGRVHDRVLETNDRPD